MSTLWGKTAARIRPLTQPAFGSVPNQAAADGRGTGLKVPPIGLGIPNIQDGMGRRMNPAAGLAFGHRLVMEELDNTLSRPQLANFIDGVIQFLKPISVPPTSGAQILYWAKATANWTNVALNASYVTAQLVDDAAGTNPGATVTIYLPRSGTARDPNVKTGDVISFMFDQNGVRIGTNYLLDDAIGTIKMWSSATIPPGWVLCNGTANSTGTAINMTSKFVRGGTTTGTTGGADTHTHGNHGAGVTSTDAENLSLNALPVQSGTGSSPVFGVSALGHFHTIPAVTHDTANNIPAYVQVVFIERLS